MNIFEQATRVGLRFDSVKGLLAVEDLWGLPLQSASGKANLDDIAKGLHHALKESVETTSFVLPATSINLNAEVELKFEVVKHIIGVRVAERDLAAEAEKRRAQKQKVLEIIARKQDEALEGKSLEELTQMVEAL